MSKVKFLGPVREDEGTESVEIDGVTLVKGADAEELDDAQVGRLRELKHLRFEIDGERPDTPAPAGEEETSEESADAGDEDSEKPRGPRVRAKKD